MTKPVKLSEVVDALEMQFDESHAYLDRQEGKVILLSDEEISAADNGDDLADYPDWQQEMIEIAKLVVADGTGEDARFLSLPDKFEVNEWDMMRDFAQSQENDEHVETLLNAIHGRGAFRSFKNRVHELGLADAWYKFRDERYRQMALDWCKDNNIEVDVDNRNCAS